MFSIDIPKLLQEFKYDESNPLLFQNGFFVFFFLAFISLFYAFRNKLKKRTYIVCLFSLYFFYKASGLFVLLVIASAVINFLLSNVIYKQETTKGKKLYLAICTIINLAILFHYKYTDFFLNTVNDLTGSHFNLLKIALPIGISFFTFENISYTVDVYRGHFKPARKFSEYLLFLSFYPKLMMGPIVRAADFIPQLSKPYVVSREDFTRGFYLIAAGLFKKLVISDFITLNIVNYVFDDPSRYTGMECLAAVYGYAVVIYCDFSGYSDIAIGIARWLGIRIPANFDRPYQSKNITEFWRRWHISLSSWLRDYLYIPLGGNRKGKFRAYVNQFITMLLGGLWHGASWNFIIWGAFHGISLMVHKVWAGFFPKKEKPSRLGNMLGVIITFHWVCFCWIFFKAATLETSIVFIKQIFTNFGGSVFPAFFANYKPVLGMILLGLILHASPKKWANRFCTWLETKSLPVYIVIFLVVIFIYLQFKTSEAVMPIYLQF